MSSRPRSKLTTTSIRTREALILAGERLFALEGLDNVSLRQINSAAGQRNSSASHYHFGSKESLLRAIYEYRMEQTDIGRRTRLDQLVAEGRQHDVRGLLEAMIMPLVEQIDQTEGGRHFIRFVAQLYGHPSLNLGLFMRGQFSRVVGDLYLLLRQAIDMTTVPDEVFGARFGLIWELVINALADRTRLLEEPSTSRAMRAALPVLFIQNLVDCAVAMMTAPASAGTQASIAEIRNQGS